MLTHHDNRDYKTAASDAARHARSIMEKKIAEGQTSAITLFEHAHTAVPEDAIVRTRALRFETAPIVLGSDGPKVKQARAGLRVGFGGQDGRAVHRHALGQLAEKAGVPAAYVAELVGGGEPWKVELAAHTLDRHFKEGHPEGRFLARSVSGELRGFLSDRYRRLDSRPLLEAFAGACQAIGAVPVDGTVSDTRLALKAFLPMVFEPIENEVMCLGIEWANSDFGNGKHTLRAMIWRLWCTNKATMEDSLAQVHLGGRLGDDIEFSQKTYDLDTRTSVSALTDTVKGLLGPVKVNALLDGIKVAHEKKIDWSDLKTSLGKKLLKSEMKAVEDAYKSEDVVNLPAGKSVWRASNAISWIAGKTPDADRRLELERLAGEVINGKRDVVSKEAA